MIPVRDTTTVLHDVKPVKRIDMSKMDEDSIRVMLEQSRDGFYSNKELAPIREYSTNALDAHIEAGIPTVPIEVTLPSKLSPELKIRDFGKGLPYEKLCNVYFQYWKSTKRNSNDTNGCLGIGAKSAMAYCNSYTVVSVCEGMKTIVTGQRDGYADIIYRSEKAVGESDGVEIIIPIMDKDVDKFIFEALNFFKYWKVRPIIHNVDPQKVEESYKQLDTKPFLSENDWSIIPTRDSGVRDSKAVMSSVPYTIDWNQVRNSISPELLYKIANIFDFLRDNFTVLYFENGTLSFTPNRESLQYNDLTVKSISVKLEKIYDAVFILISDKIKNSSNLWEAKINYNRMFATNSYDSQNVMYSGNLDVIKRIVNGRIFWNDIPVNSGSFDGMELWDANTGLCSCRNNVTFSSFCSYVKDSSKNEAQKCSIGKSYYNQSIYPSPKALVFIQSENVEDYLVKGLAKKTLLKDNSDIRNIYVLRFNNQKAKDDFFSHNKFDSVPVVNVADHIDEIKVYLKSIRKKRVVGSSEAPKLFNCPYITIENRDLINNGYASNAYWHQESVNAHGVDGGIFVTYQSNGIDVDGTYITGYECAPFWQSIYLLSKETNTPLPKVYGIHPRSVKAVWFKEAIEEKKWISLSEWIQEQLTKVSVELLSKIQSFAISPESGKIGFNLLPKLKPLITSESGLMSQYMKTIEDVEKSWHLRIVLPSLKLKVNAAVNYVEQFDKLHIDIQNKYPMMSHLPQGNIASCKSKDKNLITDKLVLDFAQYINMVDSSN